MILALAIAVAALALRLAVAESLPVIDADGVAYVTIARQFQETGSPFHPLFHPLYPICIGLIQPLVGDWETTARLVSAIFGALMIVPAFVLARAVVGASTLEQANDILHDLGVRTELDLERSFAET